MRHEASAKIYFLLVFVKMDSKVWSDFKLDNSIPRQECAMSRIRDNDTPWDSRHAVAEVKFLWCLAKDSSDCAKIRYKVIWQKLKWKGMEKYPQTQINQGFTRKCKPLWKQKRGERTTWQKYYSSATVTNVSFLLFTVRVMEYIFNGAAHLTASP